MEILAITRSLAPALLTAALLFAHPGPADAQTNTTSVNPYTVLPGDRLEISVWQEAELQRVALVRPDGAFSFPLIGDVQAIGKTVEQIRLEVTQKLQRYIPDLVVTVTVAEIAGNRIFVIGQVAKPGVFVVNPAVDVMQALALAGGATPFAALDEIKILRRNADGLTSISFDYGEVIKGRKLSQNIILQPGDTVIVP